MANTTKSKDGFTLEELMSHLDRLLTSGCGEYKIESEHDSDADDDEGSDIRNVFSIIRDDHDNTICLSEIL